MKPWVYSSLFAPLSLVIWVLILAASEHPKFLPEAQPTGPHCTWLQVWKYMEAKVPINGMVACMFSSSLGTPGCEVLILSKFSNSFKPVLGVRRDSLPPPPHTHRYTQTSMCLCMSNFSSCQWEGYETAFTIPGRGKPFVSF